MATCSYLTGDGFDGENHVTGDFVHIADLEASCGPVPDQNVGEDKLVLISDEHALVLHRLEDLAEVDVAADLMFLKDGLYVVNHKCCEEMRGRAEDGEAEFIWALLASQRVLSACETQPGWGKLWL